ncbi:MAG: restriction endonuclease subunit S [Eubacterium sp.]|jgi:type I restriction enzyme S subunit
MAKLVEITGKALSGEWGTDDETGDGIPILRTTNFTNEGVVDYKDVVTRTITKKNIDEKYLRSGDIIIEKSGGSDKQPVGRVIYFDGPEKTYLFNNFTGLLRVKNQEAWFPKYVFYSLYGNYRRGGTRPFENKTTGLHNLKTDDYVSRYEVAETDYKKQVEVCEHLDRLYNVIKLREEEIQKLDDLIKARFVEMFGDPITNSFGWEEHWLDEYIEFLTSGSRGWAKYFTDVGNELFITIKNVKNNQITIDNIQYINAPNSKEAKRTRVKTGDLLISITADLGRTGVVDEAISKRGAYINQHLSLVRLDQSRINPLYVSYFLETEGGKKQFESKNQNGVKAGLNFEAIRSLKILVPPMELQEKYLTFVNQVNKSKVEIQQALEKTQLLFDSLMQQYFG